RCRASDRLVRPARQVPVRRHRAEEAASRQGRGPAGRVAGGRRADARRDAGRAVGAGRGAPGGGAASESSVSVRSQRQLRPRNTKEESWKDLGIILRWNITRGWF